MNRLSVLWVSSGFLSVFGLANACGGSTDETPVRKDAGSDATLDAAHDAKPDAKSDAGSDGQTDAGIKPGLGDGCDGTGTNPTGCATGLNCYVGTDPQDDPGRWPGGYCTRGCSSDSQCAPYGGVCAGAFQGSGRCMLACSTPPDCRQGYACVNANPFGQSALACVPTGFIATRGAGVACFQHTDPSGAHYAATLPLTHFAASQQIDGNNFTSNEIALAVNLTDDVVLGANAFSGGGYDNPAWYGPGTTTPVPLQQSLGPKDTSPDYSDPYITSGNDGSFYYSTLGINFGQSARVLVARSTDKGANWNTVKVNPDSDCAGSLSGGFEDVCLDHPWLAIGPDKLNPTGEALYAAYLATRATDYATVIIRSIDGGQTWGIPGAPGESLAVFSYSENALATNLITPAVDDQGVVHMVATAAAAQPKGSVFNSIQYSRSDDGGATRSAPIRINPSDQPVPFEQAAMAADNGKIFVAYVAGDEKGAWDIYLAQSSDGVNFTNEKVNDEPEACATHFHPAISVDRLTHKLYVGWYDGRFAPYEGYLAVSVCDPSLSGKQCGPNEAIGDQTFFVTTDRLGFDFIGDYFTLAARPNGTLWAGFGDTRQDGISHAFVARGTFQ